MVAATTPGGDRDSGALDLYLARPVSRARYLSASAAVSGIAALVLPAVDF